MSPNVGSSSYPCGIGNCNYVYVSKRALEIHRRKSHGHGVNYFWKCPYGGPKCDTTKLWLLKDHFRNHLRIIHGIDPDNNYISRCIDYSNRRSTPSLLAYAGPPQKPLQEEPTQERSSQELPAGWLRMEEATPPILNVAQAGPTQELVRTQGPTLQSLMPRAPPMFNIAQAGGSQGALPQDEIWEGLPRGFHKYLPLNTPLPERLDTGLPQEVLSQAKLFEGAPSQEQPPAELPAQWRAMPRFSMAKTIASSTADVQYVDAHIRTAHDHISPDSAGRSNCDPRKPDRHQSQGRKGADRFSGVDPREPRE